MKPYFFNFFFFLFLILLKCQPDTPNLAPLQQDKEHSINYRQALLSDSLLHKNVRHYLADTSNIILMKQMFEQIEEFRKFQVYGDINGDKQLDSAFLVPELQHTLRDGYEDGVTVIFSDPKIPYIKVNQMCVQFQNFSPIGDIDEDGWLEMLQYYSSCASRYKSLILLKCTPNRKEWAEVESCTYDTYYDDPPWQQRIRKLRKNQFEMIEIENDNIDEFGSPKKVYQITWE